MEWNTKKITCIHFFGDSLTAGYGAIPGKDWVSLLDSAFPSVSCINHGTCANLFQDMIDEIRPFLAHAEKKEGFFLMGGTNDILSSIRLPWLMNFAADTIPGLADMAPLTIGLPPLATKTSCITGWQMECFYKQNTRDIENWNAFLKTLCTSHSIPYIDFSKALPPDDKFYADGLHPNAAGYELFYKAAADVFFPGRKPKE